MNELLNEFGNPDDSKWYEVYQELENLAWREIENSLEHHELPLPEISMISLYFSTNFSINFAEYILKKQVEHGKMILRNIKESNDNNIG
jgi:hypothetical protein